MEPFTDLLLMREIIMIDIGENHVVALSLFAEINTPP